MELQVLKNRAIKMKKKIKKSSNSHRRSTFSKLSDGRIECNGSLLRRLSKRVVNKKWIIEYFKCKNNRNFCKDNSLSCKFSGKLFYKINTEPHLLEIIKDHSPFCTGKKRYKEKRKNELENFCFVDNLIESDEIPIANISVQLHENEGSDTQSINCNNNDSNNNNSNKRVI